MMGGFSLGAHPRDVPVISVGVTETDLVYGHLADGDPVMRELVDRFGHPDPFARHDEAGEGDHFAALVRYVSCQHAQAVPTSARYERIRRATGGFPSPVAVAALGIERLGELGLPGRKAECLVRLARAQLDGAISLDKLSGRTDEEVRAVLTTSCGIASWAVDMFLIRRLNRPDVLPVGDIAFAWFLGRGRSPVMVPDAELVARIGRRWAPFRTYATALLWALFKSGEWLSAYEWQRSIRNGGFTL